jgi:pimeloyl-ACP methyl ester carboxylesterase
MVKLPIFTDDALRRLDIPVLAIVGGRDVLLDSAETKRRLEAYAPKAEVVYLAEARHFIPGQTETVLKFLRRGITGAVSC